jgi:5-methylcytosine-specific restriction endonuclease McrA
MKRNARRSFRKILFLHAARAILRVYKEAKNRWYIDRMNFKSLSDDLLHERTLSAASDEKQATLRLLEFLEEVDGRRLYSARGFSSLWEYVHISLGYSESQASERVSAMRLMRKVPEVKELLSENKLTLTSTAKLASFVRRENCSVERTSELLDRIAEKSVKEVERVLSSEQTVPAPKPDVFKAQGLENTRVSFDADSEFLSLYEELKNLQGQPKWEMNERLKDAMKVVLKKKKREVFGMKSAEPEEKDAPEGVHFSDSSGAKPLPKESKNISGASNSHGTTRSPDQSHPVLRAKKVTVQQGVTTDRRYFSAFVKHAVRKRSGNQCEYVDLETKRRCTSRFGLHFDHITPFAKGGASILENCRHLCANHNLFAAVQAFGEEKMARHSFR